MACWRAVEENKSLQLLLSEENKHQVEHWFQSRTFLRRAEVKTGRWVFP